jgi:peptidylprolyl isomerase
VKKTLVLLGLTLTLATVSLSACGTQTDARVSESASAATSGESSPSTAPSDASAAPSDAAPSDAAPSEPASTAPAGAFVSVDCASGQQTGSDTAPKGTMVDGVTASLNSSGVPTITVPATGTPAATLGTADLVPGTGPAATAADVLTVDYCGVGLGSKALFDSSWQHGSPATFPLNGVIAGWQQGVPGMKAGGTRLLVIPGSLAYGSNPPPGSGIASDETLIFVVTLRSISK